MTDQQGRVPRKVVAASMIGATIEWYDFFLYGAAAALVFNVLFFPASDPLVGTMLAFLTYALGFAARPLGGLVFGHFGDRIGRKKLLMISLVMMGVATVLIGVLPTYAQVGIWAPIMLVGLRLVQGFAVGGEWGGAVLLVAEQGDAKRRGFWASWPQAGVPAGNLLAAGVLAIMAGVLPEEDFMSWGWRVPFLLSAVLIAVGMWVRFSIEETPAFEAARKARAPSGNPAWEAITTAPMKVITGGGLRVAENISFYLLTTFSITFVLQVAKQPRELALNAVMAGSAVELVTLPFFAILSDKIGRKPVYALAALGMGGWAFAFFPMLASGSEAQVYLAVIVGMTLHGMMYGPQAAFLAELFETRVRYSGVSLSYQVTSVFAGSLAPIIAVALLQRTGSSTPISIYLAAACVISFLAAVLAKETKGRPL